MMTAEQNCYDLFYQQSPFMNYCRTLTGSRSRKFDMENPHVYRLFTQFAHEARNKGHKRYSANGIFERMRWETSMSMGTQAEEYKLSNNLRAYYARKLMHEDSTFKNFFSTR